ncbi:acyl-CoA desaturase [Acaryochloris marina NIES-2412]|uniref:acyl-CoA desaturase n=1 Tax=Acaryochloris marina TaxID=155978 RepID=UPI004058E5A3
MTRKSIERLALYSESLSLSWPLVAVLALFHGLMLFAPWFFSWNALALTIFLHWLFGSVGICLGYHRLLTHRSLQLPQWLEYGVATIGALALQGGPLFWVGTHRMHHAFTEDNERDPYSANRGFWWSHLLWLVYPRGQTFDQEAHCHFAPRLARDPYYRWLERYFIVPQVLLGVFLYGVGGWSYVIYGIVVRTVLLWHSTWLINSASHMWGYRNFAIEDGSRNLWWAALLTYGEGWHNNHHAQPRIAPAGRRWWEIDMTWWVILGLERLGLAHHIHRPVLPKANA